MTIAADAARAVVAERYQAAVLTSAATYRTNAIAAQQRQQATDAARAEAQARTPVIIGDAPAPQQPAEPSTVVTLQRPGDPQKPAPLPALGDRQPTPATDLLKQMRANASAAEALKTWPTVEADMPFAAGPMAMVVNNMPRDDADLVLGALEEAFDLRPSVRVTFLRALAGLGREAATVAGDSTSFTANPTTTKGQEPMAETLPRPDAERRFKELTSKIHDARARNDHMAVRQLAEERETLAAALYPGDNAPPADAKRVVG